MHVGLRWAVHLGRSRSTIDCVVGAVKFGPAFFKDHDPNFRLSGWLGPKKVAPAIARKVVIDDNFSIDSFEKDSCHVDAVGVDCQTSKNLLDSIRPFCYSCDCAKEVAISESTL